MLKPFGASLACLVALGTAQARADPVSDFYTRQANTLHRANDPGRRLRSATRGFLAASWANTSPAIPRSSSSTCRAAVASLPPIIWQKIAPHDGTVIEIVSQGLAVDQALGISPPLKADLRKFNWIANVDVFEPVAGCLEYIADETLEDAKKRETLIGTTGAGSASVQYPAFYNNVLGTKFKIVFGYPGGQEIDLAMQRGEVEGRGN